MDRGLESRTPSGLFPGNRHERPTYREPHPVRFSAAIGGAGAGTVWLALFGLLATSARSYVWLTLTAALLLTVAALALARFGDRGVAVGLSFAGAIGVSVAVVLVIARWATTGWPLW
jgi:hypothetical protein